MASREAGMTERAGPGERAEVARRNRFWLMMSGFMLLGAVIGGTLVAIQNSPSGSLPAIWAIAITVTFVAVLGGGTWYFYRDIDEVERRDNLIAGTIAINFYAIFYPAWFFLWKGGLVREPDHEIVFVATLIVMSAVYFWKKLRP